VKPADPLSEVVRRVTERELQSMAISTAQLAGWRHYHAFRSDRSPVGWPDLALLRGSELIFAELKTMSGRLTTAQEQWLAELARVETVEAYLWRPADAAAIRARLLRAPR
jgi:hypothetical protein